MITGASISTKERPSLPAKERGGPLRFHQRDQVVVAHQQGATAGSPCESSSPRTSIQANAVLIGNVVQQRVDRCHG